MLYAETNVRFYVSNTSFKTKEERVDATNLTFYELKRLVKSRS